MTKEIAEQFIDDFSNGGIKGILENLVWHTLGVTVDFDAQTNYYHWTGHCVTLIDRLGDATEQLTATPLLRQMFRSAEISATVGYDEEADRYSFRVRVAYEHSYAGGRNGLDLMCLTINRDKPGWKIFTN